MSVGYILQRAGDKIGLNPKDSSQRAQLLKYANEGARELYQQADPPGSLWEWVMKVNGDQTISMPSFLGELRGVREVYSLEPWHTNQMKPRYMQFNWKDLWRNWRIKSTQALQATVTNQSVGVITVAFVENPPVVVTVTGPTAYANNAVEVITMNNITKYTTNQFLDYKSFTKDRVNSVDVVLSDVDGKHLSTIPNDQLYAQYEIIDVSALPWLPQSTSTISNWVEVLYKKKLPWFFYDSDEYPVFGCDDILVDKILQLYSEEKGAVDAAVAYDTKATRTLARMIENQTRETEDHIALSANPHDTVLPRIGGTNRRRYGWWRGKYT